LDVFQISQFVGLGAAENVMLHFLKIPPRNLAALGGLVPWQWPTKFKINKR